MSDYFFSTKKIFKLEEFIVLSKHIIKIINNMFNGLFHSMIKIKETPGNINSNDYEGTLEELEKSPFYKSNQSSFFYFMSFEYIGPPMESTNKNSKITFLLKEGEMIIKFIDLEKIKDNIMNELLHNPRFFNAIGADSIITSVPGMPIRTRRRTPDQPNFSVSQNKIETQENQNNSNIQDRSVQFNAPNYFQSLTANMQIDGYKLINLLGREIFTEVWEAEVVNPPIGTNLLAGQRVAFKFYNNLNIAKFKSIKILREFSIASQINHPGIVKIFDLVISPNRFLSNFITMEFIKGVSLKKAIPLGGMETKKIIYLFIEIFETLIEVHRHNAIHRNIKSESIIIYKDGKNEKTKILDFGIIEIEETSSSSIFMENKHYAPLEQLIGREYDRRIDIYAAGAVMFHCYFGRPMYHMLGSIAGVVFEMIHNPQFLSPKNQIDKFFVDFVNRCISIDPSNRPISAEECIDELHKILKIY